MSIKCGPSTFCGRSLPAVRAVIGHKHSNGENLFELPLPGLSFGVPVYTSKNPEFPGPLILKRDIYLALSFEFGGRVPTFTAFKRYLESLPPDAYVGVMIQDCSGIPVNETAFTAEVCKRVLSEAHPDCKRRFFGKMHKLFFDFFG
jgi:hypothetical protein